MEHSREHKKENIKSLSTAYLLDRHREKSYEKLEYQLRAKITTHI